MLQNKFSGLVPQLSFLPLAKRQEDTLHPKYLIDPHHAVLSKIDHCGSGGCSYDDMCDVIHDKVYLIAISALLREGFIVQCLSCQERVSMWSMYFICSQYAKMHVVECVSCANADGFVPSRYLHDGVLPVSRHVYARAIEDAVRDKLIEKHANSSDTDICSMCFVKK